MENERLVRVEESNKSAHKRLDEQAEKISELEKTYSIMEKMDYRMQNVEDSVSKIDQKLEKNSSEKGMKWDKLIDYLFYVILAYALYRLGLK